MRCALELGPGKVLQGLMRSVRRDVEVVSLGNGTTWNGEDHPGSGTLSAGTSGDLRRG